MERLNYLKKAINGHIPQEIIDRPKQGFSVPVYEWFFQKLGNRAREELDSFCDQTDFLNRHAVTDLFEHRETEKIWYLLNFALWWKEYIEKAN